MSPIDDALKAARSGQELLDASGRVIARRLEILGDALRDPSKADLTEMTLMGSEKLEAATASAFAGARGAAAVAEIGAKVLARETSEARKAMDSMASARSPIEAAAAQGAWAASAWSRALSDSWTLGAAMLKAQTEALAPLHKAATANAKRLKV